MTQELIINGVNFLDPRIIGLKVYVYVSQETGEYSGVLRAVDITSVFPFTIGGRFGSFKHCRLAQGDKTPYEGNGQPVPDGVMVKVWERSASMCAGTITLVSDDVVWDNVKAFQVQEQKLEDKQTRTKIPEGVTKVVNAVTGEEKDLKYGQCKHGNNIASCQKCRVVDGDIYALYEVISSFEGISMRQSTACDLASHILSSGYSQAAVPTELLQRIDAALGGLTDLIYYCDNVAKILKDNGFAGKAEALENRYMKFHSKPICLDDLRKQLSEYRED